VFDSRFLPCRCNSFTVGLWKDWPQFKNEQWQLHLHLNEIDALEFSVLELQVSVGMPCKSRVEQLSSTTEEGSNVGRSRYMR
jgi:hypothetical protein